MAAYDPRDIIEGPTRLSHSRIWELQREYYTSQGPLAWSDWQPAGADGQPAAGVPVPMWITSNAFMAERTATLILHTWRDLRDALGDPIDGAESARAAGSDDDGFRRKYVILELGTGHGRFSYQMLCNLLDRARAARVRPDDILYIMTDVVEKNVQSWMENPKLRALAERGNLDFAILDAAAPVIEQIELRVSKKKLVPGFCVRPCMVIANYVFDSLPIDAFQVVRVPTGPRAADASPDSRSKMTSQLLEVGLQMRRRGTRSKTGSCLNDIDFDWISSDLPPERACCEGARYYLESEEGADTARRLNSVLDWYLQHACDVSLERAFRVALGAQDAEHPPDHSDADDDEDRPTSAMFTLPVGAVRCLEALKTFTGPAGFVVFAADKGMLHPAVFAGAQHVDVQTHGSVSFMLNFHALHIYMQGLGGMSLISRDDDVNIKLACLAHIPRCPAEGSAPGSTRCLNENDVPLVVDTFREMMERFGPSEFYDLQAIFAPQKRSTAARRHEEAVDAAAALAHDDAAPVFITSDSDEDEPETRDAAEQTSAGTPSTKGPGNITPAVVTATRYLPSVGRPSGTGGVRVTVRAAVALCRLSDWDPDVYHAVRPAFEPRYRFLTPPRRKQIADGLNRMLLRWSDWSTSNDLDPAFEAGRLLQAGGDYNGAMTLYMQSLRGVTAHHATAFNLGMCAWTVGRFALAWQSFGLASALHPGGSEGYPLAAEWRERARAAMDGEPVGDAKPS